MPTRWIKLTPCLIALVLLGACKTTLVTPLAAERPASLQANARLLLGIPPGGSYGTQNHAGSGQSVAGVFEAALLPHTSLS